MEIEAKVAAARLLAGGGEMGERIRAHDWAATPMGAPETWPLALLFNLGVCLRSSFPTAIYWGPELRLLYNDAWAPIPAERHPWALGRPASEVWADIWDIIEPQFAKVLATGEGFAVYDQMLPMERDGEPQETYWNYSFSPILNITGDVVGVLNQGNETTATIFAQRALKLSQERLQLALGASNSVGTWDWDVPSNRVTADERFARLYGVDPELAARGAPITEFFVHLHPEDLPALQLTIDQALKTGEPFAAEYRLVDSDGTVRWVAAEGRCTLGPAGEPLRFPGVTFDISERKRAEEALHESEARFRGITNSIEQMVWSTQPDGYHDFYNQRWYEYTGVPQGSTDGEAWNGMFHPDDQERAFARWRHSLETGEPYEIEYRLRHRSGAYRWVLGRAQPVRGASGQITRWFGTCTDIQDIVDAREVLARSREELEREVEERTGKLMQAEELLRQSQKMEAVGRLTGGIAHDFNNMLAVVIGGLNLLERKLARGDTDVSKYIDAAMEGATRAAALTQRLLAFSRQQPLAPEAIDPNQLVGGMIELLARTLGEHIRIATDMAPDIWRAKADARELENTILNLAVNARDAMPGGGHLSITTANRVVGEGETADIGIAAGDYILITVGDTGTGMSAEVIAKAFEPFFTTKAVGKGTGLGLSQVFGFVSQSGGHVAIDSQPGAGTRISLFLPRALGQAQPSSSPRPEIDVRGGSPGEIILVVEDEERVRNYSVEALRELGYTVIHAGSGAEALAMVEAGQDVTLLFTDMVMPEMTGRELAARTEAMLPKVKILYTTGYARDTAAPDGMLEPGMNYLAKPFGIDQLAAKVRSILDG